MIMLIVIKKSFDKIKSKCADLSDCLIHPYFIFAESIM